MPARNWNFPDIQGTWSMASQLCFGYSSLIVHLPGVLLSIPGTGLSSVELVPACIQIIQHGSDITNHGEVSVDFEVPVSLTTGWQQNGNPNGFALLFNHQSGFNMELNTSVKFFSESYKHEGKYFNSHLSMWFFPCFHFWAVEHIFIQYLSE